MSKKRRMGTTWRPIVILGLLAAGVGWAADTAAQDANIDILSAVSSDRCLDVRGGVPSAGTPVQIWTCNGTRAQQWRFNGVELRSNLAPNLCLDVQGGGTAAGTRVQVWTCNGTRAQQFERSPSGELRSRVASDRCVDVRGGSSAPGTPLQIWSCNGTAAQRWRATL